MMPPEIISIKPLRAHRVERTLTLPLKGIYFDQIKRGEKLREFRLVTPFWRKRLLGQRYDRIVLTRGYPPRGDAARRLVLPWQGYRLQTLQHEHFGPAPVEVFAIDVSGVPLSGGISDSPPGGSTA